MKLYPNVNFRVLIWALSLLSIFYFSYSFLPRTQLFPGDFIRNLANWDGGHYLSIAENGYKPSQFVFFPFYPLLINIFNRITGDFLIASLLISFISIFLAVNLLYKLVKSEFGKVTADRTIIALLFFPFSFHFLTVYTESLFLFLTVATFLLARSRKYFLASIVCALSSATRFAGLATVLSLIIPIFLTEGLNRKNWWVLFSPLGLLLYSFYQYNQTGDFLSFVSGQSAFWNMGLVLPGSSLLYAIRNTNLETIAANFRNLLDLSFTLVGIFAVFRIWRKLSMDYAIFSIVSLLMPLFSPTIVAIPRYLVTIFPIFILFGLQKNQYLIFFYQTFSLMLLAFYAILFINGYWVS